MSSAESLTNKQKKKNIIARTILLKCAEPFSWFSISGSCKRLFSNLNKEINRNFYHGIYPLLSVRD